MKMQNIYSIPVRAISGEDTDLSGYRGEVLLIVNVASRCGFTPQYSGLQALYEKYKNRGFEILAFPCNDFAEQEPGNEPEIATFCEARFAVTFPLFGKIKILGEAAHPLYRVLQNANLPLMAPDNFKSMMFSLVKPVIYFAKGMGKPGKNAVQWNFQKFLIDRQGRPTANFASQMAPLDPQLTRHIEKELASAK